MEVESIEQLRQRLASTNERLDFERTRTSVFVREVDDAAQRQRLREMIEDKEEDLTTQQKRNVYHMDFRRRLDSDLVHRSEHERDDPILPATAREIVNPEAFGISQAQGEVIDCSQSVVTREFEWRIVGLSWLENALRQDDASKLVVDSHLFRLNDHDFDLLYSPVGRVGKAEDGLLPKGSLVLRAWDCENHGISMRYCFFVKDPSGDFVPWGEVSNECHSPSDRPMLFGPDLQWVKKDAFQRTSKPVGIFGLRHDELLKSKWVREDTLVVKVHIELRLPRPLDTCNESLEKFVNKVLVPPSTLQQDLSSLYQRGHHGDVTFVIDGERIQAHAAILSVRSEVFERELSSGMRESACREIHISDVDIGTFKVFLKFLYTDDLDGMDKEVRATGCSEGASSGKTGEESHSPLLRLLSISHRYQVARLRLWCENQLCKLVSLPEVCSILCQAHLYQAAQLEQTCLSFIKANMARVVATAGFVEVAKKWPEVMLKINLCVAGVSGTAATNIVEEGFGSKHGMSFKSAEPESKRQKRE